MRQRKLVVDRMVVAPYGKDCGRLSVMLYVLMASPEEPPG